MNKTGAEISNDLTNLADKFSSQQKSLLFWWWSRKGTWARLGQLSTLLHRACPVSQVSRLGHTRTWGKQLHCSPSWWSSQLYHVTSYIFVFFLPPCSCRHDSWTLVAVTRSINCNKCGQQKVYPCILHLSRWDSLPKWRLVLYRFGYIIIPCKIKILLSYCKLILVSKICRKMQIFPSCLLILCMT